MKIEIDGMHCQACVARVKKAIEKVGGATADKVEVGNAEVSIDAAREPAVLESISNAGYPARKAS